VLIPGVLDSTTNHIEHPALVAERLCRFAEVVGRENVIAGHILRCLCDSTFCSPLARRWLNQRLSRYSP